MSRASEEVLAQLHGMIGEELIGALQSDCPRERMAAVDRALKFLKDNNITASIQAAPDLERIRDSLPTAEDLERLMKMTP